MPLKSCMKSVAMKVYSPYCGSFYILYLSNLKYAYLTHLVSCGIVGGSLLLTLAPGLCWEIYWVVEVALSCKPPSYRNPLPSLLTCGFPLFQVQGWDLSHARQGRFYNQVKNI